jgi:hypothetical protein
MKILQMVPEWTCAFILILNHGIANLARDLFGILIIFVKQIENCIWWAWAGTHLRLTEGWARTQIRPIKGRGGSRAIQTWIVLELVGGGIQVRPIRLIGAGTSVRLIEDWTGTCDGPIPFWSWVNPRSFMVRLLKYVKRECFLVIEWNVAGFTLVRVGGFGSKT